MHLRPLDPPVPAEGGGAGRLPAVLAPGHDEAVRTRALASCYHNNVQFATIMPLHGILVCAPGCRGGSRGRRAAPWPHAPGAGYSRTPRNHWAAPAAAPLHTG